MGPGCTAPAVVVAAAAVAAMSPTAGPGPQSLLLWRRGAAGGRRSGASGDEDGRGDVAHADVLPHGQRERALRRHAGRLAPEEGVGDGVEEASCEAVAVDLHLRLPHQPQRLRGLAEALLSRAHVRQLLVPALRAAREHGVGDRGAGCRGHSGGGHGGLRYAVAEVLEVREHQVRLPVRVGGGAVQQHVGGGVEDAAGEADVVELHLPLACQADRRRRELEAHGAVRDVRDPVRVASGAALQPRVDSPGGCREHRRREQHRGGEGRGGHAVADVLKRGQRHTRIRGCIGRDAPDQDLGNSVHGAAIEANAIDLQLLHLSDAHHRRCSIEAVILRRHVVDQVVRALGARLQFAVDGPLGNRGPECRGERGKQPRHPSSCHG
mmetsp:Transcript_111948/g.327362  ORF Transcript_111948/g.327362 Transcript_111948/m.327362 type:complete len:380 (+) Transcript_111948:19-1158(+)